MARKSAGILAYRYRDYALEVLLVHPGGPFWVKRDLGAWSIPKGEFADGEPAGAAALREFEEETGWTPRGDLVPLGEVRQKSGKVVTAFAVRDDFDIGALRSNRFEMEWPARSGRIESFPEVDRAGWFGLSEARQKILAAQEPLLDRIKVLAADEKA